MNCWVMLQVSFTDFYENILAKESHKSFGEVTIRILTVSNELQY